MNQANFRRLLARNSYLFALLLLIVVILFKPEGLLGTSEGRSV